MLTHSFQGENYYTCLALLGCSSDFYIHEYVSPFNNVAEVDFVVESNQSILSSSNILGALFNNDDEMMS